MALALSSSSNSNSNSTVTAAVAAAKRLCPLRAEVSGSLVASRIITISRGINRQPLLHHHHHHRLRLLPNHHRILPLRTNITSTFNSKRRVVRRCRRRRRWRWIQAAFTKAPRPTPTRSLASASRTIPFAIFVITPIIRSITCASSPNRPDSFATFQIIRLQCATLSAIPIFRCTPRRRRVHHRRTRTRLATSPLIRNCDATTLSTPITQSTPKAAHRLTAPKAPSATFRPIPNCVAIYPNTRITRSTHRDARHPK